MSGSALITQVAVIGEFNTFTDGIWQLHTFRVRNGAWELVQTINAPAVADFFGDELISANDKYLVAKVY